MDKNAGDTGNAICFNCEALKTITYKLRDVPLRQDDVVIKNILVGVCDDCDSTIILPSQSTEKVKSVLDTLKK